MMKISLLVFLVCGAMGAQVPVGAGPQAMPLPSNSNPLPDGPSGICSTPQDNLQMYGAYLNCLSAHLNENFTKYDNELIQDTIHANEACFASSVVDARRTGKCFFPMNQNNIANLAWSNMGPLAGCQVCLTFAQGAVNAIMGTNPEVSKCVRQEIYPAIARETGECLQKSFSDFAGVPEIPDFDEAASKMPAMAIDAVSREIIQQFRVAACATRNPTVAANTAKCLENPPIQGYRREHCAAIRQCTTSLQQPCQEELNRISPMTCGCFKSAGEDLQGRLSNITIALKQMFANRQRNAVITRDEIQQCSDIIVGQLRTNVNDWFQIIQSTLNKCAPTSLDFSSGISFLCNSAIRDMITRDSTDNLDLAFRFLTNLIDALAVRVARFCPGPYCQQ